MDYIIIAGILIIVAIIVRLIINNSKLKNDVECYKKQVEELGKKSDSEIINSRYVSEELREKVKQLLEDNRKVEAIKIVREETGMSLLEAKNYVDSF